MERDRSCDLDASFANRNDGQLISTMTPKTRVSRSPGVTVIQRDEDYDLATPDDPNMPGPTDARMLGPDDIDMEGPSDSRATGMDGLGTLSIPGFGEVNVLQVAAFMAVGAAAAYWFLKHKKASPATNPRRRR